jgi:hypothetical protein
MVFDLGLSDAAGFPEELFAWSFTTILCCAGSEQIDDFFSAGASGGFLAGTAHGSSS